MTTQHTSESVAGEKKSFVNKGHYFELETPERVNAFYSKLARGWEAEYKEYRRLWYDLPAKEIVRDYPLLVDLETVSRCNLKCPMCPTVTEYFVEKRVKPFAKGQMSYETIEKVIDEIAGKVYSLRLSWIGEPTLHPNLVDAVRLAKGKGIKEVSFLTNGSRLELDYFIKLQEAGVDIITVSVDGMDDSYNAIRAPLKFNETLAKLRAINKYKLDNGLEKPLIKIQGVWPAIKDTAQEFYNLFSEIVDLIAFNALIDYLRNDKEEDVVYEDSFICPHHYQRVTISSNGEASMCTNDDFMEIDELGNMNQNSIHEIWHGEKLNQIRRIHKQEDGFMQLKPCRHCYYPRKTSNDEYTIINGRKIMIESYINRSQVVGS